ncbi:DUF58 domain-containing protein [Actinoallomurus iriomotensis]|uniref:DUF58 domain-containing protein n=1 Tax=Actinoallomurus iriomotensis TaxID=478107 RepID=A0A9W6VPZ3_9ACTN|nr:DUF58 domain-containing protein [Actinoallomurus iriomotensis]GLY80498.1 hypothetical protein Airi01_087650 [Actinoallomurus iriomotensis]
MPTRTGVALLVAGLCCLAGGYRLGYPELDVLGCAALLAVVLAVAAVAWRPSLELSRDVQPTRVPRGDPAVCVLTVGNTGRLPMPRTVVHDRLGSHRVPVEVPFLRPGGETTLTYRLDTTRRGVFEAGPLRWERRDCLGLASAGGAAGEVRGLYVHPATHPMTIVPSGRARNPEGPADTVVAGGTVFHRLREYVAGDDLRRIHWRSTARTGTLMVRENLDTSLPATTVLLDTAYAGYDGDACFEEAVEVAASALAAAVRLGFPARCVAGESAVEAKGDAGEALDFLAGLSLGTGPGVSGLAHALPHRRTGAALIAVTGRTSDADLAALRQVAPRFDGTALIVLSAEGAATPAAMADGAVRVIAAGRAAEACARWNDLAGGRP